MASVAGIGTSHVVALLHSRKVSRASRSRHQLAIRKPLSALRRRKKRKVRELFPIPEGLFCVSQTDTARSLIDSSRAHQKALQVHVACKKNLYLGGE
jgi:hypothetical protein